MPSSEGMVCEWDRGSWDGPEEVKRLTPSEIPAFRHVYSTTYKTGMHPKEVVAEVQQEIRNG